MIHLDQHVVAAMERAEARARKQEAAEIAAESDTGRQTMNQHNEYITQRYAQARQAELVREARDWNATRPARRPMTFGKRVALAAALAGGMFIAMSLAMMVLAG
jgi:hypothetical protein